MLLDLDLAIVNFGGWLCCRECGVKSVRRLYFKDLFAVRAFEDTFGGSHDAPSA